MNKTNNIKSYGLVAEFAEPAQLINACNKAREAGYKKMDAYSPFPIEELHHALGLHDSKLGYLVLVGGILGCIAGFSMQYFASVIHYPINVGGKPLNSWPAFIPITFELTILGAALAAVFGMLALNGLPMPYHPLFNVDRFALASKNRFFLCIESLDPQFDTTGTTEFLKSLNSSGVFEVEP